jgi:hypothetical protein
MFSTLRKFPVIFLMMLQFIAPLVHAHASGLTSSYQGLHVPGLEHYNAAPNTLIAQMNTLQFNAPIEGVVVSVEIGLEQNQANPQTDSVNCYCLHQPAAIFDTLASRFDGNFSPQPEQPLYRLFTSSLPPRAPPAE